MSEDGRLSSLAACYPCLVSTAPRTVVFGAGAVGSLLLAAMPGCASPSRPTLPPPDVVFIVVDTLRADAWTPGGGPGPSPRIEEFALESAVFLRAESPASCTVPAHGSMFTGLLPSFHGAESVPHSEGAFTALRTEVPLLPELLRGAGYRTEALVANGWQLTPEHGFARGFDRYERERVAFGPAIVEETRAWFAGAGGPRFLFANLMECHEPYQPRAPWIPQARPGEAPLGDMMTSWWGGGAPRTAEGIAQFRALYAGAAATADEAVGGILDAVRAGGRWDQTLVIVTSDHGELLSEHGLAGHGEQPWEEQQLVPLLIKWPEGRWPREFRAGQRVEHRVGTVDLFSVVLAAAGLPLPTGQGHRKPLALGNPVRFEDIDKHGRRVRVIWSEEEKTRWGPDASGEIRWARWDLGADPSEAQVGPVDPRSPSVQAAKDWDLMVRPAPGALPSTPPGRREQLRSLGYTR